MQGRTRALARAIGGAAAACAVLAVAAPAGFAASATYEPIPLEPGVVLPEGTPPPLALTYAADEGANQLDVSAVEGGVQFADALAPAVPLLGCETGPCPLTNVQSLAINLGVENDELKVHAGFPSVTVTVDGGPGVDSADAFASSTPVTIKGVEEASGGPADDTLTASDDGSVLYGQGGNDNLTGGPADDTLVGGVGNDTISAADGIVDTIVCGEGRDTVVDADFGTDGVVDSFDRSCESVSGALEMPLTSTSSSSDSSPTAVLPVPVLAQGVASPRDVTAPSAYLRSAKRQRLAMALKRGLLAPVGCAESCGVSINVLLDRKVARKLDLAGRTGPAVIGTATTRLSGRGARTLRVRFASNARRALNGYAKGVTVTLQVLVSDASGNATLLQRRITLRR